MLADMPVSSMLEREVYVFAEVDRLIGLTPGTAKRWINGYERDGTTYDPVLRIVPREGAWVTWGEFVEARMLAEYRDIKKIRISRLRETVDSLRQQYGREYPLAHLKPYLSVYDREVTIGGNDVGLPEQELAVRTGQLLIGDARWIAGRAALQLDERGEAIIAELPADKDFPDIVINPGRYSGQPTFTGSRISPVTIAGMVAAGERREDVAADYGLSLQQVDNAKAYTERYRLAAA
jgi:uncharacterized protein (DUF433 family)